MSLRTTSESRRRVEGSWEDEPPPTFGDVVTISGRPQPITLVSPREKVAEGLDCLLPAVLDMLGAGEPALEVEAESVVERLWPGGNKGGGWHAWASI